MSSSSAAGPPGLSAARRLAVSGVRDVVVLEREGEAGGIPRHCGHTGFGIGQFLALPMTGPAYARRLVEATHGIGIRTRTTVTAIEPGGRLHVTHPDSGPAIVTGRCVLLATGVRETPRSARLVSGTRPWGVTTTGALQQFVYLKHAKPFSRVVVVGTELVSFSALLTTRHAGIAVAAMLEEGERITARRPGDWIARHVLGVPVLTRTRLVAIRGLDKVEGVEIERAGRRETIACDGVVFTGRFQPETAHPQGEPHRAQLRDRRPRHRPVLPLFRPAGLRRRQPAAPGRDLRPVLGRGPHRRLEYRPRPQG